MGFLSLLLSSLNKINVVKVHSLRIFLRFHYSGDLTPLIYLLVEGFDFHINYINHYSVDNL